MKKFFVYLIVSFVVLTSFKLSVSAYDNRVIDDSFTYDDVINLLDDVDSGEIISILPGDYNFGNKTIIVNKDLTFVGAGASVNIIADFVVNANVTFDNVNLVRNSKVGDSVSNVIVSTPDVELTVINSTFTNNVAGTSTNGGYAGVVVVKEGTTNVTVNITDSKIAYTGAINRGVWFQAATNNGQLNIDGTEITNENTDKNNTVGVSVNLAYNVDVSITNSTISSKHYGIWTSGDSNYEISNTVINSWGAIYTYDHTGTINVSDSELVGTNRWALGSNSFGVISIQKPTPNISGNTVVNIIRTKISNNYSTLPNGNDERNPMYLFSFHNPYNLSVNVKDSFLNNSFIDTHTPNSIVLYGYSTNKLANFELDLSNNYWGNNNPSFDELIKLDKEDDFIFDVGQFYLIPYAPINSISIDSDDFNLVAGKDKQLTILTDPTETTDDYEINWNSSNESVAKVSATGKVTALKEGTSTIEADVNGKKSTVNVTVTAAAKIDVDVDDKLSSVIKGDISIDGLFPEEVILSVGLVDLKSTLNESVYTTLLSNIEKDLKGDIKNMLVLDLEALSVNGNNPTSPTDGTSITITIPLPSGYNGEKVSIVYVNEDGTYEVLDTIYNASTKTLSFTTDHFSLYALVEIDAKIPDTSVNSYISIYTSMIVVGIGLLYISRKRFTLQ